MNSTWFLHSYGAVVLRVHVCPIEHYTTCCLCSWNQCICSFAQITAEGMIVDETIVRQKVAQKDNKEYNDAMLARAVVARTVEMEVPSMQLYFLPELTVCVCVVCAIAEETKSRNKTKA